LYFWYARIEMTSIDKKDHAEISKEADETSVIETAGEDPLNKMDETAAEQSPAPDATPVHEEASQPPEAAQQPTEESTAAEVTEQVENTEPPQAAEEQEESTFAETPEPGEVAETTDTREGQEENSETKAVVLATPPEKRFLLLLPTSTSMLIPESRYRRRWSAGARPTGPVHPRRIIRRRRWRAAQGQQKRGRITRLVSVLVLVAMLLGSVAPLSLGLAAYTAYAHISDTARSGINHLLAVKTLLPNTKDDLFAALDSAKLKKMHQEFQGAENDFIQLEQLVQRPDIRSLVNQFSPEYSRKLLMAHYLVRVALDVARMGQEVSSVGLTVSEIVHSSPLAGDTKKPLISVATIAAIEAAMIHAVYYIDDIGLQMRKVRLDELPLSSEQKKQLLDVLKLLPQVRGQIGEVQGLVEVVAWLLGVGQQRRFLVQTMDRAELRPGGGFTGQYGILSIKDGRMAPFSLHDVAQLDYAGNGMELGRSAPPEYSWMNFGNWGLRDSNLSADYPTTARMNMRVFEEEGGGPVDGNIAFTPTFIGHILDITGPVHVKEYNETITAKNLEERLHYYQQDYSAIAIQRQKTNNTSSSARKTFTTLVGKMLLDRVRQLPTKRLLDIMKNAVKDIQARDLQIYFTHPTAQQWLTDHGLSGAMDSFKKQDGFMVVQANISISKASQYVHTTLTDNAVLDAQGGITHNLVITLDYQQKGPIYGYDTYANYLRTYAPQTAQLLYGHGFDTGQCYRKDQGESKSQEAESGCCTTNTIAPAPTQNKVQKGPSPAESVCEEFKHSFPDDARYCPSGNYDLGMRGLNRPWTVNRLGGPTALQSDLTARSMWGGLTVTPKNCISTITLSWYVPGVVKRIAGQPAYTLLIQKQGGYIPALELNVDTSAVKGLKPFHFKGDLTADRKFTLHK
jgi:hypothetical protein